MITEDVDSFGIPLSESDDVFSSLESSLSKLSSLFSKEIRSKISRLKSYDNEDAKKLAWTRTMTFLNKNLK